MRYSFEAEGTAVFVTVVAVGGATYAINERWRVKGEVGIGDMMLGGLDRGNPFTKDGASSGLVHMLGVRLGIGASCMVNERLTVQVSPLVTYGAGSQQLADDIPSIRRLSLLAGITYTL
jgi:hypothetical protein